MEFDTLVLSGGSIRGFCHLGAIQFLHDKGYFSGIKKYIGTSIGGILGYLFSIGYSPIEIMIYLNQQNVFFENLQKIDLVNLVNGMGALQFSVIHDILEKMTVAKIKRFITLQELYDVWGKELILCAFNEREEKEEMLSFKTHPSLPCLTALRMTSNLPFLFEPFEYGDSSYIDGGVVNNFPISFLDPTDRPICIQIKDEKPLRSQPSQETNLLTRIYSLVKILMAANAASRMDKIMENNPNLPIITISSRVTMISFSLTSKEKFDLFSSGYEAARLYFQTPANSGNCF